MYFPLVVHGALLIEPTETESKDALDHLIAVVKALARRAKADDAAGWFHGAPYLTPRRRRRASRRCAGGKMRRRSRRRNRDQSDRHCRLASPSPPR
jgi:glycine dehydrogenase subunit 2